MPAARLWAARGVPFTLVLLTGDGPPPPVPGDLASQVRVVPASSLSAGQRARLLLGARGVIGDALPDLGGGEVPIPEAAPGKAAPPAAADAVSGSAGGPGPVRDAAAGAADAPVRDRSGPVEALLFDNGTGGFTPDGREYVIRVPRGPGGVHRLPPRPWINVLANERFGALVSEAGAGATWSGNSREHRLTPWSNDPVLDPAEEALYVRDDESGFYWSPTPGPCPAGADYTVRHGFGVSAFTVHAHGLAHRTEVFVDAHLPAKVTVVRLRNDGERTRRLSVFSSRRLVLGSAPEETARFITVSPGPRPGGLTARNPAAGVYAESVAVASVSVTPDAAAREFRASGDRERFLGRNRGPERPAGLERQRLEERTGAGLDPAFVQQASVQIAPGEEVALAFILGEGADEAEAMTVLHTFSRRGAVENALRAVRDQWQELLGAVRVATPSPALDVLVNGWLGYQALACRIRGRTAFYQSGGAFGFRDQLQDASAFSALRPEIAREQIVNNASHQFVEGDVLHWWHPPQDRGLRTRFADDLVWLPYLTAHYVAATGDLGVLDEAAPFVSARALAPGEDEAYLPVTRSGESADVYEHCARALDRAMTRGAHGLPLFGSGDWNDGMNRVGREGKGESVWMGFFLYAALGAFLPHVERRGDAGRAARYAGYREDVRAALETAGWDGEWYRRAYYDDGTPLGSRENTECRIDALVQAWSVLSGAAPPARARAAMDAVERELISERDGIIRLLTPPFDRTSHDPGYIKGYLPGVRENGGQYTHAALWVVRAMAELGRNDRAAALLDLLNPIRHSADAAGIARYQVEPYVICADVYGAPPHVGRGGWTWYTGSAGWMLRVALESVLGLNLEEGKTLVVKPCVPDEWPEYSVRYRVPGGSTVYTITVRNPDGRAGGVVRATLDGAVLPVAEATARVPLTNDGGEHRVEIVLGPGEERG